MALRASLKHREAAKRIGNTHYFTAGKDETEGLQFLAVGVNGEVCRPSRNLRSGTRIQFGVTDEEEYAGGGEGVIRGQDKWPWVITVMSGTERF